MAVVGATERPGSYGDTVMRNLLRAEFAGPIWGVHPTRAHVHGRDCVPSAGDLPEPVDAVVFAIPAAKVPAALRETVERGCRGAVVFGAGFGEIAAGASLERELVEIATEASLPLCGPNGNGVISVSSRAPLWGDSVPDLLPGPVAIISQSGNLAVNAIGSQRGIDFHTIVSTGNQAVLDAPDWLGALAEREGVRSIALFLEEDGDGPRLTEALAQCADRGVRVAVLKTGSSQAGARAAAAHTGALAGDQRVFRALVEEAGGAFAADPHELLELARALAAPRAGRPRADGGGGLAVLTCSGGDSGVAADRAEELDLNLPELAGPTIARLEELLPETATAANPLDYTSLIWGDRERLASIVETVGADPAIDQLLLLYDHPEDLRPEHETEWTAVRSGLADGAGRTDAAAMIASTLPDLLDADAARELAQRGIPAVAGLDTGLRCIKALRAADPDPARLREIGAAAAAAATRAGGSENGWLGEAAGKSLLRGAGLPVPDGAELDLDDEDGCLELAHELGWPVALKLSAPHLLHKTDAGAIVLGIAGDEELVAARHRLSALPAADGSRLLLERMADPGVELLISARADAVVPALTVALGGVWAEALSDAAVVPLPAGRERVEAALLSLRGARLLSSSAGDAGLRAAAEFGARVGEVLMDLRLELIELNPVLIRAEGCVAVDALVRA